MAIAQSLITHISLNLARLCFYRIAKVMRPGGALFVSFFERDPSFPLDGFGGDPKTFNDRDPFWHYLDDLKWAASCAPWDFHYIGDWGHPMGSKMLKLVRAG